MTPECPSLSAAATEPGATRLRLFSHGWSEGRDGPGRRLVFYLKGCPLRCAWCANPESIRYEPEMLFHPHRADDTAPAACPRGAVLRQASGYTLDRAFCAACDARPCVTVWRHPAFEWAGEEWTVERIVAAAREARPLMAGGGVTFGGGEATSQAGGVVEATRALRAAGIHVAVESNALTTGYGDVARAVDLMISDLKVVDPERHRAVTGVDNARIRDNLRLAAAAARDLWLRVPLIVGVNDDADEQGRIAEALLELSRIRPGVLVQVLRMHHIGEPKWAALDRPYPAKDWPTPTPEAARAFMVFLRERGVNAVEA